MEDLACVELFTAANTSEVAPSVLATATSAATRTRLHNAAEERAGLATVTSHSDQTQLQPPRKLRNHNANLRLAPGDKRSSQNNLRFSALSHLNLNHQVAFFFTLSFSCKSNVHQRETVTVSMVTSGKMPVRLRAQICGVFTAKNWIRRLRLISFDCDGV